MFVRKVVGSSRDFGVQIWEDHLHLKDHLHRLRTGLGPTAFLLVEAGVYKKKRRLSGLFLGLEYLKLSSGTVVLKLLF